MSHVDFTLHTATATASQPPVTSWRAERLVGADQRHLAHHASILPPFRRISAQRGCLVLTYDYRGIGGSIDSNFDMARIWRCATGARRICTRRWAGCRLRTEQRICRNRLGSIGGQLIGLASNNHLLAAVATGSQIGYWRNWPPPNGCRWAGNRAGAAGGGQGFRQAAGFAMGGVSLPAGIALEWARWCQHPTLFR